MKIMHRFIIICICLVFQACSNQASHIPPVWQLPFLLSSVGTENYIHDHKEKKIKQYVKLNYKALRVQIKQKNGSNLDKILNMLNIKKSNLTQTKNQLFKNFETMFYLSQLITERIMRIFTSLYMPKSKYDKTINGFSYSDAYHIIQNYLINDFEKFRLSIKQNKPNITTISKQLKLTKTDIQTMKQALLHKYDDIFIDPVVVGFMVQKI